MTEREIYEKYDNLSEHELNVKSNKNVFVKNIVMANIIKHCRGEKKRGIKVIDGFREKINDSRFWNLCVSRTWLKSKIGIIFANEKILEEHSVKVYEIDPYFYEHHTHTHKKKLMKMGMNIYYLELMFILLNIF